MLLVLLCVCACVCTLVHILETGSAKTSPMMLSKVTNPNQPLPNHWIPGGALAFFTLKPQDSKFMGLGTSAINTFRETEYDLELQTWRHKDTTALIELDVVAHTSNPSTQVPEARGSSQVQD